ncbi:hypothetical protein FRC06_000482 [Ceratobasidium sp. 370]|nr:hypothetical protein FRC06_000482 [Ceratobasidium sp. 370]
MQSTAAPPPLPPPQLPPALLGPPATLHAILEALPEPTTTASGIALGQALFDTPEPDLNNPEPQESEPQESTRRSQRVHIDTPGIAQYRQEVKENKARRHRHKSRQSSTVNAGSTTEQSSTEEGIKTDKARRKSCKSRKKKSNSSTSEQSTYDAADSEPDRSDGGIHIVVGHEAPSGRGGPDSPGLRRTDMPPSVVPDTPGPGVSEIPGIPVPTPSAHHGQAGGELRPDVGHYPGPRQSSSGRPGPSPGPGPGPGPSPGSSPDFGFGSGSISRKLGSRNSSSCDQALERKRLIDELTQRTGGTAFAQVPLETLKLMLKEVVRDQTPQVETPRRKAQAQAFANNPIKVGGGHRLKITQSYRIGSKAQHTTNTDTEPSNTDTEPEIDTELEIQTHKPTNALRREQAICSPSPLPSSHIPIDPTVLVPGTQTQPETFGHWEPTGSVSLGDPPGANSLASRLSSQQSAANLSVSRTRPINSTSTPTPSALSRSSRLDHGILHARGNPGQPRPLDARRALAKGVAKVLRESHTAQAPGPSSHARGLQPAGMISPERFVREHYRTRHERANAPTSNSNDNPEDGARPGRRASSPDLMSDNEEQLAAAAAQASGREPKRRRKKKPAARDIHGNERYILTIAKQHLFAYVLTEGAWQTRGLFARWAPPIYVETWEQELPGVPVEPPSPETIQIMVNSLATARGRVKDALCPFTQYTFGFEKPTLTPEATNRNLAIFREIHPNRFHCLEYQPAYGHYESGTLSQAIAVALFSNPSSVGVTFQNYFDPMPLTTVAFVLANVQFCIEEYEHGQFQPHDLNAADMLNKYVAHLRGLKEARAGAKARVLRLQQEWFDYGFEYSGAMMVDDPFTQIITLRSEIRPDTPPAGGETEQLDDFLPEDEPEVSEPENGQYSKRAKGKGRA